jgi:hypothetical protein
LGDAQSFVRSAKWNAAGSPVFGVFRRHHFDLPFRSTSSVVTLCLDDVFGRRYVESVEQCAGGQVDANEVHKIDDSTDAQRT